MTPAEAIDWFNEMRACLVEDEIRVLRWPTGFHMRVALFIANGETDDDIRKQYGPLVAEEIIQSAKKHREST
jgi:hypothetical protein